MRNTLLMLIGSTLAAVVSSIALPSAMAVDAVVVRPSAWAPVLQEWKQYRAGQGRSIVELDAELGREEIRSRIAELYFQHPARLRFVVLAADVSSGENAGIPTFYRESSALVQFGGDRQIATDNPYGDVDGDDIPELAVARIPADSGQQLQQLLRRIIAYEASADFSQWRRQVHVVAGVGGFGALADSLIEMTTRSFLSSRIPGWSNLSMTQASTDSLYCPDPWRFSEACVDRLNEGGMFWVYIGHGHVKTLDYVRAGEEYLPILTDEHLPLVDSHYPPIAVFLACYTGAFDAVEDSLAERLVMLPQGPIASIAASRVSGPYGLSMLSDCLLYNFYDRPQPTLGEVFLAAKQRLLTVADEPVQPEQSTAVSQLQMINAIAKALSPKNYSLHSERLEHVWQVHLLGDPMLRVQHPTTLEVESPNRASPGESVSVFGETPVAGRLTIELAYRRDQARRELVDMPTDVATASGRENLQQRYLAANDRTLAMSCVECAPGAFRCEIAIPPDLANGKYCLRLFLESEQSWQVGYRELIVRQSSK